MIVYIRKKFLLPLLAFCLLAGSLLPACNKEITPLPEPERGNIFFYNASGALLGELTSPNRRKANFILIDSQDSNYVWDADHVSKHPYFDGRYITSYPQIINDWPTFFPMQTGTHTLRLTDSSGTILTTDNIIIDKKNQALVFYGDSCGIFRSLVTTDIFTPTDSQIGMRLINLSPGDGKYFLTINKKIPAELPAATHYGDHTGFVPMNIIRQDTFSIKVFSTSDSSNALSRTSLIVAPGHAYTLLMSGYPDNHAASYKDPRTGEMIYLQTTFTIKALKNY
ncbi:hypothetical protein [Chitinophaga flava]|uniref:DUF4397 domain-containing protein n=1 Tax=Chitinophaga flava TaxID=2259036 RepID=A0A365XT38_9BACT|nr:hypothetical protein [Chitinophaga flava]RBL89300.1 hypothetical protein DF182_22525 [Chitinophaga flava]